MKHYYQILEEMGLSQFNYTPKFESPCYKNEEIVLSRLIYAIEQNEKILVYGDYDVDGLCCLLAWRDFFESIGYENASYYHYSKRTHLIDARVLYQYVTGDYDLLIVCDAGSNSMTDIVDLKERQRDIVILDHHKSDYDYAEYPNNCYILNSMMEGYVMSAGALVYTVIEKLYRLLEQSENPGISLYGLLSMYSDCVDMSSDFGRGLYFKVMDVSRKDYPVLITDFMLEYSVLSRRVMEYQIAPKINAIFRSENFSILNDYLFGRTEQNVAFIKEKVTAAWLSSRKEMQKISDYIEVTVMKNFVVTNLDLVARDVENIPSSTLHNYTGLLANILSSRYGKPCLVFCSESSVSYKISLRDFLSRNYLEVFKLFSDANGHPSAFGIYLKKQNLSEFMYFLDLVDKGEYVSSVQNEPYIVRVDQSVVSPDFVKDIALYNEFSGNKIPLLLLQKVITKKLPQKSRDYGDYRYGWGDVTIKSASALSVGMSVLLKPYRAKSPIVEVETQKLL